MRSISNLLTKNVCMMDKRAKKRTTYMVTTRTTKVVPKAWIQPPTMSQQDKQIRQCHYVVV